MPLNIGIYVYDDVEVLDFAGPYEVFTTATRMHARTSRSDRALFNVFTIGRSTTPVRARAGLKVDPDFSISDHPPMDCLIVPGGVVNAEMEKADVIRWISDQSEPGRVVAAVCTGAFMLAKTGKLAGKQVTTHWEDIGDLKEMFPSVDVLSTLRWVDEGSFVTSAGISAGIDMSLHLVERLHSRELAERTALQMDFDWTEND
ncbi:MULTISPECIES: DJ-1/PfpI family protein [Pseudomonas syringae group]|uniref:ThiJ/PfpI family protein n=3 Tax=Pseudomonas syringae group TaxID=136849 RepID=A0A0P9KV85_PSECA|nr:MULTISPECIES: DJ-1/PfpI family protein [Pseudomonas syringae group]KAA8711950.1 DJ-1/PfpI family protein [Pseudomonas cannabina]KPB71422.1 ThiJ/PfpI family protein [Pseudomonas syringae pv. maculicola]KPW65788.1 ThiJ/PfpI family protein [Pseudomonas cannabina]MBM0138184.1 DJ-1/PfpI family protein [Pseudomonas cannabina pv. alisalensis]QHE97354.1 DJ-1/PfpI family protein [Pseudomonas syringae pv. maculicola str. ES4326]